MSRKMSKALPEDMIEDLKEAFAIYDTENNGTILMSHVRNILWNFGMWRITKKEMEMELSKFDIDVRRPYLEWQELLAVIA
jgi:Ca2+-binding EF-hand superfamily protein